MRDFATVRRMSTHPKIRTVMVSIPKIVFEASGMQLGDRVLVETKSPGKITLTVERDGQEPT